MLKGNEIGGRALKIKDIIINFLPNSKFIGQIYKNHWKEILSNKILLIIVIGLTLIPSLYAWFNIEAFWDPYGNTKLTDSFLIH